MTTAANDVIALSTAGVFRLAAPTAPTISIALGTGAVTVTITGDVGVTNYLKYRSNESSWQDGGSRSGDGDITVSSLANGLNYIFLVYAQSAANIYSLPSIALIGTLSAAPDGEFDTDITDHADEFIDRFGEAVTYKPAGGGSRSITAIVTRLMPGALDGPPHGTAPSLVIDVLNDATTGISSSELDTGGDAVSLPVRIGETAQDRSVTAILEEDHGILRLELR